MRFKPVARFLLFAGLCVSLTSVDMLLSEGLSAPNSRIVFTSTRHHSPDIFVMDADGGNQERLTIKNARDSHPTWSPDRTKIAYVSEIGGRWTQIYVMDARGKGAIKLTDGPGVKRYLDWSPDGLKIAYTSWKGRDRQNPHIIVMDADGNNAYKLTDGEDPSWSPDGQRIAFASGSDWHDQIFVIGVDGDGLQRLTQDAALKGGPVWSPDGKQIAYMALQEGKTIQIYVIRSDGTNRKRLTHKPEHHKDPSWSPDGRLIAYVRSSDIFPSKIHLMTADGKYVKKLSGDHRGYDYYPDFGPVSLAVSPASNKVTIWGRLKSLTLNLR